MSATALPTPPPARSSDAGRVVATVAGAVIGFIALVLLLAGGVALWADTTQRDADGWLSSPWHRFETPTRALTAEGLELGRPGDSLPDFGSVRIRARAADGGPVFLAIAPEPRVDAFLRGVAHTEVTEIHRRGFDGRVNAGAEAPNDPAGTTWTVMATGPGTQTVRWTPESGRWAFVVMNADGSPGIDVELQAGARATWLLVVALGLLGAGLLAGLGSAVLIGYGVTDPTRRGEAAPLDATPAEHPVLVSARLDKPLSRWLWLVKWLLLIPHAIVLAFLWAAFVLLTLVALVAIVITGRYPRGLFDFNAGVLRWTWRVGFYGSSAFATDRYPPFSLRPDPEYPAELEIPYPERLSRWKALLKPWLLALPHYAALAALLGTWNVTWTWGGLAVTPPGLLGVLLLVALVLLLVRGRYPRDVFSLVVGINRWALRVAAYAALMRDEYPPFRLDR
jgi:hypothetical protein